VNEQSAAWSSYLFVNQFFVLDQFLLKNGDLILKISHAVYVESHNGRATIQFRFDIVDISLNGGVFVGNIVKMIAVTCKSFICRL
jgi:hypothetical protein